MNLGIYGGTFNPPHLGHLIVAETVGDQFGLDKVLWIPSGRPPHKDVRELVSASHRLAMTRRAVAGNRRFSVSDVEVTCERTSYTVDTLGALQRRYPEATLHLILGGDSLRDFASWYQPEVIVERARLAVYDRPGTDRRAVPERFLRHARFAEAPLLAISGTEIRDRCRRDASIRYLVPEGVRAYIQEHGLYGGEEGRGKGGKEERKRGRGGERERGGKGERTKGRKDEG